jgi:predicted AAA+ superfamily ATPase
MGKKVVAGKTLLFLDEIQYARRGLLALKYFKDKAPQYHVVATGSLLGVIDNSRVPQVIR